MVVWIYMVKWESIDKVCLLVHSRGSHHFFGIFMAVVLDWLFHTNDQRAACNWLALHQEQGPYKFNCFISFFHVMSLPKGIYQLVWFLFQLQPFAFLLDLVNMRYIYIEIEEIRKSYAFYFDINYINAYRCPLSNKS